MKRLRKKADLLGYFTNHSLRATAAKRLFENNVDEQLIMSRTGDSTTSGVCSYKKTGEILRAVTSDVLNKSTKAQAQDICKELKSTDDEHLDEEAKSELFEEVKPEQMDKEAKASSVSGVDSDNKKEVLPMLNLEGATNFTININMAK